MRAVSTKKQAITMARKTFRLERPSGAPPQKKKKIMSVRCVVEINPKKQRGGHSPVFACGCEEVATEDEGASSCTACLAIFLKNLDFFFHFFFQASIKKQPFQAQKLKKKSKID